jgi:hypothetical protein
MAAVREGISRAKEGAREIVQKMPGARVKDLASLPSIIVNAPQEEWASTLEEFAVKGELRLLPNAEHGLPGNG